MSENGREGSSASSAAPAPASHHYSHQHTASATFDIWMAVDQADHALTFDEIYKIVRPKLNHAWLMTVVAPRIYTKMNGSGLSINADDIAWRYLKSRVWGMSSKAQGYLVNETPGKRIDIRYKVGKKPKEPNYVPIHETTPTGWREVDLEQRGASGELHTARFNWHEQAIRALARARPRTAELRTLVEQAQELVP